MANVKDGVILLDQLGLKTSWFEKIVDQSLYPNSDQDAQNAYEALRGKSDKFEVYRRSQVPSRLHFDSNPRAGDPVIVANGRYFIRVAQVPQKPQATTAGAHGYDTATYLR